MTDGDETSTVLSEFLDARKRKGPTCSVGVILDGLPEDRAVKLRAALAADTDTVPHTVISAVVTGWISKAPVAGRNRLGVNAVTRHRAGACACQPS
jgi:hypothetical protein